VQGNTGPIRTSFYLEYEDWDANGKTVKESKIISLDLGNNLSKFETNIDYAGTVAAGITLHENDGKVSSNDKSWLSYWQPHADSELGTAIVAAQKDFYAWHKVIVTGEKDLDNAYFELKVLDKKLTYYAGYGWKKAGEFITQEEWEQYLKNFSKRIDSPLIVKLKE